MPVYMDWNWETMLPSMKKAQTHERFKPHGLDARRPGRRGGGGKVFPYLPIRYEYGGAMPILLRKIGEPFVVDMRAVETLPVVVNAVD